MTHKLVVWKTTEPATWKTTALAAGVKVDALAKMAWNLAHPVWIGPHAPTAPEMKEAA